MTTTTEVVLKVCTKCGEGKPATEEFFARDGRIKNGLIAKCRSCVQAYNREYYESNRERVLAVAAYSTISMVPVKPQDATYRRSA